MLVVFVFSECKAMVQSVTSGVRFTLHENKSHGYILPPVGATVIVKGMEPGREGGQGWGKEWKIEYQGEVGWYPACYLHLLRPDC